MSSTQQIQALEFLPGVDLAARSSCPEPEPQAQATLCSPTSDNFQLITLGQTAARLGGMGEILRKMRTEGRDGRILGVGDTGTGKSSVLAAAESAVRLCGGGSEGPSG